MQFDAFQAWKIKIASSGDIFGHFYVKIPGSGWPEWVQTNLTRLQLGLQSVWNLTSSSTLSYKLSLPPSLKVGNECIGIIVVLYATTDLQDTQLTLLHANTTTRWYYYTRPLIHVLLLQLHNVLPPCYSAL